MVGLLEECFLGLTERVRVLANLADGALLRGRLRIVGRRLRRGHRGGHRGVRGGKIVDEDRWLIDLGLGLLRTLLDGAGGFFDLGAIELGRARAAFSRARQLCSIGGGGAGAGAPARGGVFGGWGGGGGADRGGGRG